MPGFGTLADVAGGADAVDLEAHNAAIADAEAQLQHAQQRALEAADAADLDSSAVAAAAARLGQ